MMHECTTLLFLTSALLAGSCLQAQAPVKAGDFDFSVKLHAGAAAGNLKDDLHAESMLGLGFEGTYAISPASALIGEVTFSSYGGGTGYDNTKFSGPIYIAGPTDTVGSTPITLQTGSSADYRKNSLQGFSLRGGYRGFINDTWSWQAGLSLDGLKYRQEASGTLQPKIGSTSTNAGPLEGFALTPTKTKVGIGAFAGMRLHLSSEFSLEANVLSVGYGTANYQPFTYTGQTPTVDSETRHGFLDEVAFGMKL
jgi:hypothetical protein